MKQILPILLLMITGGCDTGLVNVYKVKNESNEDVIVKVKPNQYEADSTFTTVVPEGSAGG